MRKAKRSYSLVQRLRLILWAMFLLPMSAGIAFFVLYSSHSLQHRAQDEIEASLRLQKQYIEYWVGERMGDVGFLAADPRILSLPSNRVTDFLRGVLEQSPAFAGLVYVDETGHTVADANSPTGVDVSDREYFLAAKAGRGYVSDVLVGRTSGKNIIIVSSPVKDSQGRFRGLVFGSMRLDTLLEQLRITQLENGANVFLAKADGTLLSGAVAWRRGANAGQRNLRKGDVLYDHALKKTVPEGVYRNVGGDRVVGTYAWVFDGRWLLAGETTEHDILALHASILGIPLLGATVLFLIFGPMAVRLVRSLEGPIRRLVEHSGRIEAGDFDFNCEPEHKPHDPEEIRSLNAAYCLMVERVQGAMEELRRASLMDVLTGAPNRKSMLQEGPRLIEATSRSNRPVSLLMIDLDHFKSVNDTYGHATGDTVLRAFTRELGFRVRGSDIFARMGGEEFAVLAPNASFKDALELGERIRRHVEALRVLTEGGELKVTVSIGVATLSSGSRLPRPLDALMASADKAMYEAKNNGRNRVAGADVEL